MMREKLCSVAALVACAGVWNVAVAGTSGAEGLDSGAGRLVEVTVSPSEMRGLSRNLWGEAVPAKRAGVDIPTAGAPRGCQQTSTHLDNGFDDTQWTAQAGFAEQEIMAASYTVAPSLFPLRSG